MTEKEIGIKIMEDLATTSKLFLLKTLDGELLKKPTDQLRQELDANYSAYCDYLQKVKYALELIGGVNVNIGVGTITIDLNDEK